jgi:hypothetical protein
MASSSSQAPLGSTVIAHPESAFSAPGRFNLLLAGQHAALQLEIFKTVAILRRFASRTTASLESASWWRRRYQS